MNLADPAGVAQFNWDAAEEVAARHRQQRLHPDLTRRGSNWLLGAAAILLWIAAAAVGLTGTLLPHEAGTEFGLAGYGLMFLYIAFAAAWAIRSGHYLWSGSPRSIRSALPLGAWPLIRQQLALRRPIDPHHRDVIVELAHQQRELTWGSLALAGFYVPLYLGIANSNRDALGIALLILGATTLAAGAVVAIRAYRRLGHITAEP